MSKPQAQNFDISRLPAYRRSWLERYHPYARKGLTRHNARDRLMMTIDHRYDPQPAVEATTVPSQSSMMRSEAHQHLEDQSEEPTVDVEESEDVAAEERGKLAAALANLLNLLRFKFLAKQFIRGTPNVKAED